MTSVLVMLSVVPVRCCGHVRNDSALVMLSVVPVRCCGQVRNDCALVMLSVVPVRCCGQVRNNSVVLQRRGASAGETEIHAARCLYIHTQCQHLI